ncbi:hypothetical protein [Microbacterium oxydans]|uniref:hypothetical protein n=1 Tax=Microbacterium oxydans TaxID=82380 RepID=UPI001124B089|nr:hypothetical protein [Microbacterium oxydans]
MQPTASLPPTVRVRTPRRSSLSMKVRLFAGVGLIATAVVLVFLAPQVVFLETEVARLWLPTITPGAFTAAVESPVAFLAAPLWGLGGVILAATRVSGLRVCMSVVLSTVLILVTNQVRLGAIGWGAVTAGSSEGYEVALRLGGSVLSVLGFSAAYLVFVIVMADLPLFGRRRTPTG